MISCEREMPSLYPSTNGTLALACQKFLTCTWAASAIPAMTALRRTLVVFVNDAVAKMNDTSSDARICGSC